MTPAALADRIAAMDWTGCSMEQQLAVAAAISTLRYLEPPMPLEPVPVDLSNVIAHPAIVRTHRTVRLVTLDTGHEFASAGFSGGCAGDSWEWIRETVAAECGVNAEQVGCAEGPDGEDFVTVDGLPVYEIRF